tara:strand:- start:457 stop:906 length:450 start_codon:yes stop_codon:yes gene_type:complete
MDERQANAKINQLLIILAEKQNAYRDAMEQDDKASLQTEIDALQSDLQFHEAQAQVQTEVEPETPDRIKQLDIVQLEARQLFEKKNKDYGDAFATYGPVGVLVRIGDKIQRLQSIHKRGITLVEDEKMRDTLIDLHNYAAMAIMLIDEK